MRVNVARIESSMWAYAVLILLIPGVMWWHSGHQTGAGLWIFGALIGTVDILAWWTVFKARVEWTESSLTVFRPLKARQCVTLDHLQRVDGGRAQHGRYFCRLRDTHGQQALVTFEMWRRADELRDAIRLAAERSGAWMTDEGARALGAETP